MLLLHLKKKEIERRNWNSGGGNIGKKRKNIHERHWRGERRIDGEDICYIPDKMLEARESIERGGRSNRAEADRNFDRYSASRKIQGTRCPRIRIN